MSEELTQVEIQDLSNLEYVLYIIHMLHARPICSITQVFAWYYSLLISAVFSVKKMS